MFVTAVVRAQTTTGVVIKNTAAKEPYKYIEGGRGERRESTMIFELRSNL